MSKSHGDVRWEDAFRALRHVGYDGPTSVEWEDAWIGFMGRRRHRGTAGPGCGSFLGLFDAAFSNNSR